MNSTQLSEVRHVLFLAPEALIGPHFEACIRTADVLASQGVEITFVGCFDQDQRCVFKDSNLASDRFMTRVEHGACAICVSQFSSVVASRGYRVLSPEALGLQELQVSHIELAGKVRSEGLNARTETINYGLLAGASLMLINKISLGSPLTPSDLVYFEDMAYTVLQRHALVERALSATGADALLVFGQYAQNMAGLLAARQVGKEALILDQPLNGDIDRSRLLVRNTIALTNAFTVNDIWVKAQRYLDQAELDALMRGQNTTMRGGSPWAYSPPITGTQGDVGDSLTRRRVVAFTSSLDEVDCSTLLSMAMGEDGHTKFKSIYPDQISWIDDLQAIALRNTDLEIIVRIHPREGKDTRSGGEASRHLGQLQAKASSWPNLQIVWPQDPVSSYDLMMSADLVTTSWSSISIEAALLGIPVVSPWYSNPTFPADSFVCTPCTKDDYWQKLTTSEAMDQKRPMERIKLALDYLAFLRIRCSIPMHDETSWQVVVPTVRGISRMNAIVKIEHQQALKESIVKYIFSPKRTEERSNAQSIVGSSRVSAEQCAHAVLSLLQSLGVNQESRMIQRLTADLGQPHG